MKTATRTIKRDGSGQATACRTGREAKNLVAQLNRIVKDSFWRGYIFQEGRKVCWGGQPITMTMRMAIKGEL